MRKITMLMLAMCLFHLARAQEVAADKDPLAGVPNDYELSDKQFTDWKNVQNMWNLEYDKIKFEYKVDLNCKTCHALYIDVLIKINAQGKMEYYKFIDGKYCARQLTKPEELRMMRFFFKFEYPSSLRNTTFKTHLGTSLKC